MEDTQSSQKQDSTRLVFDFAPDCYGLSTGDGERLDRNRVGAALLGLRLEIRDQGLVLRGHTDTYYATQLALHAVLEVSAVPILANEIDVI